MCPGSRLPQFLLDWQHVWSHTGGTSDRRLSGMAAQLTHERGMALGVVAGVGAAAGRAEGDVEHEQPGEDGKDQLKHRGA